MNFLMSSLFLFSLVAISGSGCKSRKNSSSAVQGLDHAALNHGTPFSDTFYMRLPHVTTNNPAIVQVTVTGKFAPQVKRDCGLICDVEVSTEIGISGGYGKLLRPDHNLKFENVTSKTVLGAPIIIATDLKKAPKGTQMSRMEIDIRDGVPKILRIMEYDGVKSSVRAIEISTSITGPFSHVRSSSETD